jgi:hypothetical protein
MHAQRIARLVALAMSTELDRIELGRFAGFGGFPGRSEQAPAWYSRLLLLLLPVLLIGGLGAGLFWLRHDGGIQSEPASATAAEIEAPVSAAAVVAPEPAASAAMTADKPVMAADAPSPTADPALLSGLSISSQSWRRGGLGSKALVSFTLRNNNDYAVKDIELVCAFTRWDGSHLTDRRRVIPDTVNMKSRRTFAHMLVGFVNVNASRAKCAPVAANRL